jgi:outer membrane biosynthesis protein TonB
VTRRELSPALMGSVALHVAVAAALLISWRFTRDLQLGSAVPVTLVAEGPAVEPPLAMQAPEVQAAQAPQPEPAQPQPAPPAAQAAPQPQGAPKKTPGKTEKSLDLDALAASLAKSAAKPASAAKGPPQAATAPETGHALSGAAQGALNGMKDQVERRWNPNCDVAGGRDVQLSVLFRIDSGGQVIGDVRALTRSAPTDVARAAADRAVRAVYAAAPFRNLPRELYGQSFKLNFDARDACS